ncbi:DUF1850 domain-containing protein [Alsobacter sp. SYSU M60028]|uniref:DUF1850 domain-containing protein n=1 Tax=Alsobacter ponti TaxID=2962936 RepID=A0ABT1LE15_9HYPH|nr:DUF1850 domain-containing protein [Alsobacter ponti]MCP8939734.1 DUF1850 domain-containing protein [Alsobacter ponti]
MALCLVAGGAVVARLAGVAAFTLAWTHSVEKTAWEEDWTVTPRGLVVEQARVKGSGAGMDPPPGAQLVDGAWRWRPALPALNEMTLRRSGAVADWRLCIAGTCRPLGDYAPGEPDPLTLRACEDVSP